MSQPVLLGRAYLAGAGAIGNGLLWAARHLDIRVSWTLSTMIESRLEISIDKSGLIPTTSESTRSIGSLLAPSGSSLISRSSRSACAFRI